MEANPQYSEAAEQKQLAADLIQLIEVRIPQRQSRRIGYVVLAQSMSLARACGIPKVFFAEALEHFETVARTAGLRLEVAVTVAN